MGMHAPFTAWCLCLSQVFCTVPQWSWTYYTCANLFHVTEDFRVCCILEMNLCSLSNPPLCLLPLLLSDSGALACCWYLHALRLKAVEAGSMSAPHSWCIDAPCLCLLTLHLFSIVNSMHRALLKMDKDGDDGLFTRHWVKLNRALFNNTSCRIFVTEGLIFRTLCCCYFHVFSVHLSSRGVKGLACGPALGSCWGDCAVAFFQRRGHSERSCLLLHSPLSKCGCPDKWLSFRRELWTVSSGLFVIVG